MFVSEVTELWWQIAWDAVRQQKKKNEEKHAMSVTDHFNDVENTNDYHFLMMIYAERMGERRTFKINGEVPN